MLSEESICPSLTEEYSSRKGYEADFRIVKDSIANAVKRCFLTYQFENNSPPPPPPTSPKKKERRKNNRRNTLLWRSTVHKTTGGDISNKLKYEVGHISQYWATSATISFFLWQTFWMSTLPVNQQLEAVPFISHKLWGAPFTSRLPERKTLASERVPTKFGIRFREKKNLLPNGKFESHQSIKKYIPKRKLR